MVSLVLKTMLGAWQIPHEHLGTDGQADRGIHWEGNKCQQRRRRNRALSATVQLKFSHWQIPDWMGQYRCFLSQNKQTSRETQSRQKFAKRGWW